MFSRFASREFGGSGGLILAFGTCSLAVWINRSAIDKKLGIDLAFLDNALMYVAIAFIIAGGIIILVWLFAFIAEHMVLAAFESFEKRFFKLRLDFTLRLGKSDDMDRVAEISVAEFGPVAAAATAARNRWLLSLDPQSYCIVLDKNEKIAGGYTIFRLSALGVAAIKRGEFSITNGPREYFRNDNKYQYVNIYIAGLMGTTRKARAMVLGAMNQRILEMRPLSIFARAASKRGLELIRDADFNPVQSNNTGIDAYYVRKSKRKTKKSEHRTKE